MSHLVIDAHNHPNWFGMTPDKIIANMDQLGISKCVLLSWELPQSEYFGIEDHRYFDPRHTGVPLELVIAALDKYPDRFIPGWAPDPRNRYARVRLKAAVEMFGVKVYGELKCMMRYDEPNAIAMYRSCADLGLPVLFHLECTDLTIRNFCKDMASWPHWYGGDTTAVANMCRLCPDTKFIGHGPGLWAEISGDADIIDTVYPKSPVQSGGRLIELLEQHSNLNVDISAGSGHNALDRDRAFTVKFLTRYQDRVLFGRDCFDDKHIELLKSLSLPSAVLNKILSGNIKRLLNENL